MKVASSVKYDAKAALSPAFQASSSLVMIWLRACSSVVTVTLLGLPAFGFPDRCRSLLTACRRYRAKLRDHNADNTEGASAPIAKGYLWSRTCIGTNSDYEGHDAS